MASNMQAVEIPTKYGGSLTIMCPAGPNERGESLQEAACRILGEAKRGWRPQRDRMGGRNRRRGATGRRKKGGPMAEVHIVCPGKKVSSDCNTAGKMVVLLPGEKPKTVHYPHINTAIEAVFKKDMADHYALDGLEHEGFCFGIFGRDFHRPQDTYNKYATIISRKMKRFKGGGVFHCPDILGPALLYCESREGDIVDIDKELWEKMWNYMKTVV